MQGKMGATTILLLLLWAGATVNTQMDLLKRIVGGQTCDSATRRYHVFLYGFNGTDYFMCGGSLIRDLWVLTAAHCLQRTMTAYLGLHPGRLVLRRGVPVVGYSIYNDSVRQHDIMLLKLSTASTIQPVTLPTSQECANRANIRTVEVAGYAATTMGPNNERGNDTASTLQCGNIQLMPVNECTRLKHQMRNCINSKTRSTGYQDWFCYFSNRVSTSPGDSGGGVVYQNKLYGVHVMGFNGTHACVAPSAAMDLCNQNYRAWINSITGP